MHYRIGFGGKLANDNFSIQRTPICPYMFLLWCAWYDNEQVVTLTGKENSKKNSFICKTWHFSIKVGYIQSQRRISMWLRCSRRLMTCLAMPLVNMNIHDNSHWRKLPWHIWHRHVNHSSWIKRNLWQIEAINPFLGLCVFILCEGSVTCESSPQISWFGSQIRKEFSLGLDPRYFIKPDYSVQVQSSYSILEGLRQLVCAINSCSLSRMYTL